ncbi:MAG TPA: LamG domain-containing protein, partial [bacterium]|nr:LamG domain-containing protein [bacterium]
KLSNKIKLLENVSLDEAESILNKKRILDNIDLEEISKVKNTIRLFENILYQDNFSLFRKILVKEEIDKNQYALEFSGNEYSYLMANASSPIAGQEFSVECWFYLKLNNRLQEIVAEGISTSTGYGYGIYREVDNNVSFGICGVSGRMKVYYPCELNKWYHAVLTYKSGVGGSAYINGKKIGNFNNVGNLYYYYEGMYVGFRLGGWPFLSTDPYFKGKVDEVRIYNRILTDEEVREHFNFIFKNESSLALYYNLNEGSGTTAYDKSGNNRNGAIYNAVYVPSEIYKRNFTDVINLLNEINISDSIIESENIEKKKEVLLSDNITELDNIIILNKIIFSENIDVKEIIKNLVEILLKENINEEEKIYIISFIFLKDSIKEDEEAS